MSLLNIKNIHIYKSLVQRNSDHQTLSLSKGFTIVELLVVIVVIGILAAITMVSYSGITDKANIATLQSDLANNSKVLKMYYVTYGSYPTTLDANKCPTAPNADTNYCLKLSSNNKLAYTPATGTSPQDFRLTVSDTINTNNFSTNANGLSCPLNFIVVPGSVTYGTDDFCVMKYEAKQVGTSTTPISTATGLPWVSITQTAAITNSPNVAGCNGCHLITEPEWMTIAQNVLNVASNWDNGADVHTVGTGFIYSGHNDNVPANALAASTDDTDGYFGTSNTTGSNQRRTLTLSNGEVIWDMSGNVYEWTNATIGANLQPGLTGEVAYAWKQWNNGSLLMNGLPANSQPASTGIAGITGWSSTKGIGQLYSNYGEAGTRAFLRGGSWVNAGNAGVLNLILNYAPGYTNTYLGFRVSR